MIPARGLLRRPEVMASTFLLPKAGMLHCATKRAEIIDGSVGGN
ncbi:MAG: hypothetical protein AAGB24_16515 [Bacteroidota bacterium]